MADLFVTEHDPGHRAATGVSGRRCAPASDCAAIVVLIHGSLDRSTSFVRVQRHLEDLHVVRYDRRGYGRSIQLGPPADFPVQVDDLASVVAGRRSVLVGHSLGGVVALALAQRHPELVGALVAYEAPMSWLPWWPKDSAGSAALADATDAEDAAERFMRRMVGDDRWQRLPPRTRADRRAEGPTLVAELRSLRDPAQPPYEAHHVRVPVVAAFGSESSPRHQDTARRLAEAVADGTLVEVAGAGHGIHLTHPAALADLARAALRRAGAG